MIIIAVSMIEEQPSSSHDTKSIEYKFPGLVQWMPSISIQKKLHGCRPVFREGAIPKDVHVDLKFCSHSNATP